MGQGTTEAVARIEQTRARLDAEVDELQRRVPPMVDKAKHQARVGAAVAGGVVAVGLGVALVARRRRRRRAEHDSRALLVALRQAQAQGEELMEALREAQREGIDVVGSIRRALPEAGAAVRKALPEAGAAVRKALPDMGTVVRHVLPDEVPVPIERLAARLAA